MSRQPPIFTFSDADGGRQKSSSPAGSGPAVSPSFVSAPSGFRQVLFGSVPTLPQYSKCPLGSNTTLPNPLALLAVIDPVVCLVESLITTRSPLAVSNSRTLMLSPEFIRKSRAGSGVKCSGCCGFAGAVAVPFLVRNAKLTGSGPTVLRQEVLLNWPVFWFSEKVSMFIAAHHWLAVHPMPAGHGAQPGG